MNARGTLGREGEDIAAAYLVQKGFHIVTRNDRRRWGELDIVAVAPDRTLVFVEVKTMRPGRLKPEDQLSKGKLRRFATAAGLYAGIHQELARPDRGWRMDAIAVIIPHDGAAPKLTHYLNVR
ncbi:MAG: YraN family protein [bacterium]|nr:YraN family protein [bacterium]